MKKSIKYKYRRITVNFDLDYDKDKQMIEWMEKHLAKKVNFNTLLKNGLELLMADRTNKI
jgi:hypothetical protein